MVSSVAIAMFYRRFACGPCRPQVNPAARRSGSTGRQAVFDVVRRRVAGCRQLVALLGGVAIPLALGALTVLRGFDAQICCQQLHREPPSYGITPSSAEPLLQRVEP